MSDEHDFLTAHAGHLAAAGGERGPCPDNEALIARVEGTLAPADAAAVDAHALLCVTCGELLARLAAPPSTDAVTVARIERALERRPTPWRRRRPAPLWAITGAAAAAAVAVALLLPRPATEPPTIVERGGGPELVSPLGRVASVERLTWGGSPMWSRYRVEVEVDGEAWVTVTTEPELALPAAVASRIAAARRLRWRVIALGADNRALATSAWNEVELETR